MEAFKEKTPEIPNDPQKKDGKVKGFIGKMRDAFKNFYDEVKEAEAENKWKTYIPGKNSDIWNDGFYFEKHWKKRMYYNPNGEERHNVLSVEIDTIDFMRDVLIGKCIFSPESLGAYNLNDDSETWIQIASMIYWDKSDQGKRTISPEGLQKRDELWTEVNKHIQRTADEETLTIINEMFAL